jgi:hypothetical protein
MLVILGDDYMRSMYAVKDSDGAPIKGRYDTDAMAVDISRECMQVGPFDSEKIRGAGVWIDKYNEDNLVINSKDLWSVNGDPVERADENNGTVYEMARDLGIDEKTQPATILEVSRIYDALNSWSWKRSTDSALVLGWVASGYLVGASKWRPHFSLTGAAAAGKSTLTRLIRNLLGEMAIESDGSSSEAGIRQAVGRSAKCVLIDEAEAGRDGARRIASLLTMLRSASSGAVSYKGTQDQAGASYRLRMQGMVSGIIPPQFNQADASRFLFVELESVKRGEMQQLIRSGPEAKAAGKALFARMVRSWSRYKKAVDIVQESMIAQGDSPRLADTIGSVIAGYWVAVSDEEPTLERATELVASFDLSYYRESSTSSSDSNDAFEHILDHALTYDAQHGRTTKTVFQAIDAFFNSTGEKGPARQILGVHGMALQVNDGKPYLWVNTKSQEFQAIFSNSRFAGGNIGVLLSRVPGFKVKENDGKVVIADKRVRAVGLPLDIKINDDFEVEK